MKGFPIKPTYLSIYPCLDRLDLVRCVYYAAHLIAGSAHRINTLLRTVAALEEAEAAHKTKRGPVPASLPNLSGPRNVWTFLDFLTRLN